MKLGALKGGIRHLTIEFKEEDGFDSGTLEIDYRPGELTFENVEQLSEGGLGEAGAVFDMIAKILVDWDLEEDVLDEEGNPTGEVRKIPPTGDGIKKVPLPALGFIFGSIMEDVRPNPPSGVDSNGGSQQEETSEKSLIGTSS